MTNWFLLKQHNMRPTYVSKGISQSRSGAHYRAALVILLSVATPLLAGTLDDAAAAIDRGNDVAARRLLLPRAENGNARAQSMLGILLYKSARLKGHDYATSVTWIRKAATQGDAVGQAFLGTLLSEGKIVPGDMSEAIKWFRKAAAQGNVDAEAALGVSYSIGRGVPQNCLEGMKWLQKSAAQGNVDGEYLLGLAYGKGQCVTQDFAEANKWFFRSAAQGNAASQCMLGFAYASGRAVTQDGVQALKWYILAAAQSPESQDNPDAGVLRDAAIKGRDTLASRLPASEVEEAQKQARDWKPQLAPR